MPKKLLLSLIMILLVSPLLILEAATKYSSLNVTDYIKDSTGTLKLDDNVKVSDNLNVKGIIKNTTSGTAVTVDDDLKVNGNITLNDAATVDGVDISTLSGSNISLDTGSGLTLTNNVLSMQKTCTDGQILKYNITTSAWECNTDVATISEASITIGSGLSLNDTGVLSVSGVTTDMIVDATIASTDIAADAIGADQLSSGAISAGDVEIGDLPAGGNWALSSNLNVDDSTLIIDTVNNRVGIGAAPRSALFVPDSSYAQFAQYETSPTGWQTTDCDNDNERGRQIIYQVMGIGNAKLCFCIGEDGWQCEDLTPLIP